MGRLDTEREALRLRSVSELIQSRNIASEIAYRETSGDLNRAQAARLRAEEPHIAAKMLADIDQSREAAGASRARRVSEETLLPIKVEQERAQTSLIGTQENRIRTMLAYEQRQADASIARDLAAAGAANANAAETRALFPKRAALLDKQNQEYVTLKANGQEFTAKGMDLAKERNDNIQLMARLAKEHQDKIRVARKDDITMLEHANKAEQNIKAGAPGGFKPKAGSVDPIELTPDIEMFHATSKNPYVYVLEDNSTAWTGKDTKLKKVDLPTVDGHRYTAQEIYDKAVARSMTVQQYLEQVFYRYLEQPVPWKQAPAAK